VLALDTHGVWRVFGERSVGDDGDIERRKVGVIFMGQYLPCYFYLKILSGHRCMNI